MKWNREMRKAMSAPSADPAAKQCGACSGSGTYDVGGSPKCGSCVGTGLALSNNPFVNYKDYYVDSDYQQVFNH